ncbi:zinc metallopeptidase [Pontibacter sp. G13]|uniref:zinc metallopeptidase n=1 Tax=Pontibacter sp. G13 TaxID=3074898 RepID=UPI0028894E82|nr:zinc metallopeptidase [Pontibacter sp. G13]WNJ16913.1 zinc metallopeptidase [Pontibacter sp. G13]
MVYLIFIAATVFSWIVQNRFSSTMKRLGQMPNSSGMTGKQIAEKMLADNGIHDVQVISTKGRLTDHYNPGNKTVNLSQVVYDQRSIAAMAIAAHECGHAVQHATSYSFLKMRSALVPIVSIGSKFSPFLLLGGIALLESFPQLLLLGILTLAGSTLFSFITLPVEYDASKRALEWIDQTGIARGAEHEEAEKGLKWAARTYVVAAVSSLGTLLYYLSIFNSRRN